MSFIPKIMDAEKEHGITHVLFLGQAAWMATLGVSKKEYFIKMGLSILLTPLFLFLGYGDFAEKLKIVATTNYEQIGTNLVAAMLLSLYYIGYIWPYLLVLNAAVFFTAKMWSKEFWEKVQEVK
jgi:hypothetical protein